MVTVDAASSRTRSDVAACNRSSIRTRSAVGGRLISGRGNIHVSFREYHNMAASSIAA